MKKRLRRIMLVDDNKDDNFFHEREIKKVDRSITVLQKISGSDALDYLKANKASKELLPDLIFLDFNMPCMNGWEFLQKFNQLDREVQDEIMIIMLTTSGNPDNIEIAKALKIVSEYLIKPLTQEILIEINKKYFI